MERLLILSLLMMQGLWGAAAADMPASVTVQTNDGQVLEIPFRVYSQLNVIKNIVNDIGGDDGDPENVIPLPNVTLQQMQDVMEFVSNQRLPNGIERRFEFLKALQFLGYAFLEERNFKDQVLVVIVRQIVEGNVDDKREKLDYIIAQYYLGYPERMFTDLYIAWLNAHPTQTIIGRQTALQACASMGMHNPPPEWDQIFVDVSAHLRHGITSLHTRPGTIAYLVANNKMPVVHDGKLVLSDQGLTVCDAWSIPNPQTIVELYLAYNRLTVLAAGIFAGLTALTRLDLHNNQITALAPGTLAGLDALTRLNLSGNQIKALVLGIFAGLSALRELYLNNNKLTEIEADTFAGLGALTLLNLNNNKIEALVPGIFAGLGVLTRLGLGANQLTALVPGIFAELSALQELFLNNNQLTEIAAGAFVGLNLIYFDLKDNPELHLVDSVNLVSIKEQYPEWFTAPQAGAAAAADQPAPDDAVCSECGGVGDACTCSADAADDV